MCGGTSVPYHRNTVCVASLENGVYGPTES